MLHRFALQIEYDGAPFHGWQRQPDVHSVQETIETALFMLTKNEVLVYGSGRTDKGVHALRQIAHIDLETAWNPEKLMGALNFHLKPNPISITAICAVPDDFHARYNAVKRHYKYNIFTRRAPIVFGRTTAWHVKYPLNLNAMREASSHLIGTHDLTTFRSVQCQAKSPVKTIDEITIHEVQHNRFTKITIKISARSFMHNQVRSIVGSLERVGANRWTPDNFKHALDCADRAACGPVAPPYGLFLARIDYETPLFNSK